MADNIFIPTDPLGLDVNVAGPYALTISETFSRPVEVLEIYTGKFFETPDVRIVNSDSLIIFEGKIYSPLPFARDPVSSSSRGAVDGYKVSVDNAGLHLSKVVVEQRLVGKRIVLRKVFRPSPKRITSIILFDGKIQSIEVGDVSISLITSSVLEAFNQQVPKRIYQTRCNYLFGGRSCGVNVLSSSRNHYGVAMRGSNENRINDPTLVKFEDGYFDVGFVVMLEGPELGQHRPVARSEQEIGKLVLRFPFDSSTLGNRYRVRQGCKKTKEDCEDRHNNLPNYGGFAEVPSEPNFR